MIIQYWIWNHRSHSVFSRRFAWHVKRELDDVNRELRNDPPTADKSAGNNKSAGNDNSSDNKEA